jgi:hypothetical protein
MRLIGIIIVVAIIYIAYGKQNQQGGTNSRVAAAQSEAAKVIPVQPQPQAQQPAPAPAPQGGGVRAPIDRTRAVMDLVKSRN